MDGFAVGSLYALIALGYTMVYGILKFINFAHSDIFVIGAWISYMAAVAAGWSGAPPTAQLPNWVWGAMAAPLALGLAAVAAERGLLPILRRRVARGIPASLGGGFLLTAGIWAFAVYGLVQLARAMRGVAALELAGGLVILVAAMAACGLAGFVIERLAYKPLRGAPRLNVLITAIGVSLLLQNTGQLKQVFGPYPKSMPALLPEVVLNESIIAEGAISAGGSFTAVRLDRDISVEPERQYRLEILPAGGGRMQRGRLTSKAGDYKAGADVDVSPPPDAKKLAGARYRLVLTPAVPIRLVDVSVVATALLLMLALEWLIFRTKLGRGMRAVSFNTTTASLMGIPVDRIISITFVLGSALAAAAGFLYAMKYPAGLKQPADAAWVMLGLKAFVAAVIGGIGNVRGAMLGGVFIGLLEFFGVVYVSKALEPYGYGSLGTQLRDVYVFSLLILVLLLRPTGILGKATVEKV